MAKQILPPNRGCDVVLYLNNISLAGQKNAILTRRMFPVTVTNDITKEWVDLLAGIKSWSLTCSGMFIKNEEAFNLLNDSFINGNPLDVKVINGDREYSGKVLITSFPIYAEYNDTLVYNITLTGKGELKNENYTS